MKLDGQGEFELFSPEMLKPDNPGFPYLGQRGVKPDATIYEERDVVNTLSLRRNVKRGVALVGDGFDLIMVLRTDMGAKNALPLGAMLSEANDDVIFVPAGNDFNNGLNDHMAIGTPCAMRKFATAYSAFDRLVTVGSRKYHSEQLLRVHASEQNLRLIRFDLEYALVRMAPIMNRHSFVKQIFVEEYLTNNNNLTVGELRVQKDDPVPMAKIT